MKVMAPIVFAFVASIAINANALSLKEQKQLKDWQKYLDGDEGHKKTVKEKCGQDMPMTIDEKFVAPFMAENTNAASYCDETWGQIAAMCEDETSKPMIVKDIKKIDCKLGEKGKVDMKLAGGTFTFTVGVGASNLHDKIKEFLENNLK